MAHNRATYTFILLCGFLYSVTILKVQEDELRALLPSKRPSASGLITSLETRPLDPDKCPEGLVRIDDVEIEESEPKRRIPRIVYQTGASRCVTPRFESAMKHWHLPGYSYRFYDDAAMDQFFNQEWPLFPHLHDVLHCVNSKTVKADLWRYLILWEYGGVYADMDTAPTGFETKEEFSILPEDDGFFTIEALKVLSQYFMAVSPHHPIMYFAVQHALKNILVAEDTGKMYIPVATGPGALKSAMVTLMQTSKSDMRQYVPRNLIPGIYVGTHGRSVRAAGKPPGKSVVKREIVRNPKKKEIYKRMNMTHFFSHMEETNKSCFATIFENVQYKIPA